MSKIQINDLDDLNVEQFATLTDLEAAGIQGGLTASELSNNLNLAGSLVGIGAVVSASFGGPLGLGIGGVLGVGSAGLYGLGAAAGALANKQLAK